MNSPPYKLVAISDSAGCVMQEGSLAHLHGSGSGANVVVTFHYQNTTQVGYMVEKKMTEETLLIKYYFAMVFALQAGVCNSAAL